MSEYVNKCINQQINIDRDRWPGPGTRLWSRMDVGSTSCRNRQQCLTIGLV